MFVCVDPHRGGPRKFSREGPKGAKIGTAGTRAILIVLISILKGGPNHILAPSKHDFGPAGPLDPPVRPPPQDQAPGGAK